MTDHNSGKSIILKNHDEIMIMLDANRIVAETLTLVQGMIAPGVTTLELDRVAEDFCKSKNASPAFKGYRGFPGSLCTSINEEVVHGIPSRRRKLKKGDIISVDFGVKYKGYYGDSAITVAVGKIAENEEKLLQATEESLERAIEKAVVGNRVADISIAVQEYVEKRGFSVVRQFVGHGIGTALHEGPEIPNFLQGEQSPRLVPGMVMAIEPMVNLGTSKVKVLRDGWTVVTADGKPSAHFEHSVAVTEDGPIVLSRRND
ncbi:type I methionyl aminopeptidase [Desulfoprunum benzoelyticum]|uniref:Methionine aminopeptidase n=1 Tax=Desulfoprunum benzoelyticum TaxID=1506996 RepID=A0A840URQ7_9BACT|nr:type I methionyl aminopeptidase [Desulfoprunum benzoelyticum]MBB5348335.1 methionyl aminopeptidase [Desulfoprunum benzoelyticum]MBM9528806.1 type I methionyl aminopeptidase [Desulfoprunum benzoelyticum]